MYVPTPYQETRRDVLLDAIKAASFGTLVTHDVDGFELSHLPFVVQDHPLRLVGHLARANPQGASDKAQALASFVLDEAYIHPGWYPSKAVHGRVVPTWNYVAVEAKGRLRIVTDEAELLTMLEGLTARHEADRDTPWGIADAPSGYVERMLRAIVGVVLEVETLTGAWKLNQAKGEADHRGVVEGLDDEGQAGIAALMEAARSPA